MSAEKANVSDCSWIKKRYTNLQYYNELEKGGHFAAFEQPEMFLNEIRTFFGGLR